MRFKKGDIITLLRQTPEIQSWTPYKTVYRIDEVENNRYRIHFIRSEAWPEKEGISLWEAGEFPEGWGLDPRYGINALLKQYYGSDTGKL